MKRLLITIVVILSVVGAAYAQQRKTSAEAKALLDKAVSFYKANGPEKALAVFNDLHGPFVNGDLYIFALDMNGKILAHPVKPKLVGKSGKEIRDPDSKNFIEEMVVVAKTKGAGTVEYKWENPQSLVVEKKSSYVEKVDAVILGCGYFTAYEWQMLAPY